MSEAYLKVVMTDHGRGEVWLNGHLMPNVLAVEFCTAAGEANRAKVTLLTPNIEMSGTVDLLAPYTRLNIFKSACDRAWFALKPRKPGFTERVLRVLLWP